MPVPFQIARFLARSGIARWVPSVRRRVGPSARILHLLSDRLLATPLDRIEDLEVELAADGIDLASAPLPPMIGTGPASTPRTNERSPIAGLPVLQQQFAERLPGRFDADEVMITHGARGAYHLAFDTWLNRGDRVILFEPASPLVIDALRQRRVRIHWINSSHAQPDRVARAIAGAKLMVMSQPDNPTGRCWSAELVEAVVRAVRRFDAILIWDRSFAAWDPPAESERLLALARDRVLIIDRSYPGGIGCLAGPVALIQPSRIVAADTTAPPPVGLQLQAAANLTGQDNLEQRVSRRQELARYVVERLTAMGLPTPVPEAGPFVWFDVSPLGMTSREFCRKSAREAHVAFMPGDRFGPACGPFARLTFLGDEGRLREGLRRLSDVVGNSKSRLNA